MSRKKVLVLGGNFAGLTAALAVQQELDGDVDVEVVSLDDHFLFNPSLIWVPFGKRAPEDIRFPVAPTFESHDVEFVHGAATRLDLGRKQVETTAGTRDYDYLVIATGYRNDFDEVPGTAPSGRVHTISTLEDAVHAGEGWQRFLEHPGDVVIGATQGAGCFGAAYEFLFNMSHQLRRNGLHGRVRLTWVTSEPFLGHFGIGGLKHGEGLLDMFMRKEHIDTITNTAIESVDDGKLTLADGRALTFEYAMIMPPFVGQDVIRDTPDLSDAKGYVPVRDTYQAEGSPPRSRRRGRHRCRSGSPRRASRPRRRRTSPRRTSRRRSAARSPPSTRSSATSPRSASWTRATTA